MIKANLISILIKYLSFLIPISSWRKKIRNNTNAIFKRVFNIVDIGYLECTLIRGKPIPLDTTHTRIQKHEFAIGITTYSKRFERFLKPLIAQIRTHSNALIIVCVNGDYNSKFDEKYRREILEFIVQYNDIYISLHPNFRSLAKLWNEILVKSPLDSVLLCNDDIAVTAQFFDDLNRAIAQNKGKSFKMNTSWSHIFLNRREVCEMGWFDERFLNIGHEDIDFEVRWFNKYKAYFPNIINIKGIENYQDERDGLIGQKKVGKYGVFNAEFFRKKYTAKLKDSPQYVYESFYWEHKNEL